MKNYLSSGKQPDLTAPAGGVVSGNFYKIGSMIVCAAVSADEGKKFAAMRHGEYSNVPKEGAGSGQVWTEGDTIYWDDTNKRFTKTATSNTKAGVATAGALTADTVGQLVLVPTI